MTATAVRFDPFSPEHIDDPYPFWADVRESAPLFRDQMGIFHISRYEDVWSLLRDRRCARDMPSEVAKIGIGDGEVTNRFFDRSLLNLEGAEHTRVRRLMSQPFTPKRIRELETKTRQIIDELLDPLGDRFDLAADFALVLPVYVICDLLGLPREDREVVRPWSDALVENTAMFPTEQMRMANERANRSFEQYFDDLAHGHRRYDAEGLFGAMLAAEHEGDRIDHVDLVVNASLLFFAGFETTTNLIGDGMLALLRNPDQHARLRDDPSLLPTAVEEMLRYDSPVQSQPRWTHEPIQLSGGTLKANRVITLEFGAANRDPRAFVDPDRFDVGRDPNHHVAFGNGTHFCLGSHLARLEARCAIDILLERYSAIELDGDHVRKPSPGLRGLASLPVRVTRR